MDFLIKIDDKRDMMYLKGSILRVLTALLVVISLFCANFGAVIASADSSTDITSVKIADKTENSYSAYLAQFSESDYSSSDIVANLNGAVLENGQVTFDVEAPKNGFYYIGMSYKVLDVQMSDVALGIKIDGLFPYLNMQKIEFPRMWKDEENVVSADDLGNEYAAKQVLYTEYYYNEAFDETVANGEKFKVYLTAGAHQVSLIPVSGKLEIEYFKFAATAPIKEYSAPADKSKYYTGETIVMEAESTKAKSSYFLVGKNDGASLVVTPQSAEKNLINYVGGGNWKTVGDTIVWETPKVKEGYYQFGFSYRQNTNIGGKSYRVLSVDGKVPFSEAERVGFAYGDSWQTNFYADENGKPYLIYLSEGVHEIALTVTSADIAQVRSLLMQATAELSELYIDIIKITGETVDVYRDYELFTQIGDMEERLKNIRSLLDNSGNTLLKITNTKSGSNYSVIKNMILTIDQMLDNKHEAHRYKDTYYTNYCSVSSVLQELSNMPLDIDKISLCAADAENPFDIYNAFEQIVFSVKRFIISFIKDYNSVSSGSSDKDNVTIWVNWGRDQAQVLSALIERTFVPETGIDVNMKLVSASVVQAILSGSGPDCFLQMPRSEPVNLAMRKVLYNLSQFEDCEQVLDRFQKGADIPYRYKGDLYALPDTQNFYVMFYRKDILEEYGIPIPKTWEEFNLAAKLLMRNNMSVYMPVSTVTDASSNGGVGSTNIFPTLLLQNGVSLYSDDGQKTNLLSADSMEVFEQWTNYYTKLKFPVSLNFYNRFRTGTTPLGISPYTQYTTFKAAAAEIEGLWGITSIPGVENEEGTISKVSSGAGTGCVILKSSKNPEGAWEFLKWWTSADTQLTFSNDLESVLGPTGRVAVANVEALKGLSWDGEDLKELLYAWDDVEEIPEYPGSYYVARSIYQAFWNVTNSNKNTKDMLMKYGKEADDEIARKWKQYTNR